jgi:hypothetical protein
MEDRRPFNEMPADNCKCKAGSADAVAWQRQTRSRQTTVPAPTPTSAKAPIHEIGKVKLTSWPTFPRTVAEPRTAGVFRDIGRGRRI